MYKEYLLLFLICHDTFDFSSIPVLIPIIICSTTCRSMQLGVYAITCYLHACRHQNESKSRKYLAKVLWLLTYDDDKSTLADAVDKHSFGVPPIQWLPW